MSSFDTLSRSEQMGRLRAVKEASTPELMAKVNVVGVGLGLRFRNKQQTDELVLVVFVTQKVPKDQLTPADFIPNQLDGVPVDVRVSGQLTV